MEMQQKIAAYWERYTGFDADDNRPKQWGTCQYPTRAEALFASVDSWLCNGEKASSEIKDVIEDLDDVLEAALWFSIPAHRGEASEIETSRPKWSKIDIISAIEKVAWQRNFADYDEMQPSSEHEACIRNSHGAMAWLDRGNVIDEIIELTIPPGTSPDHKVLILVGDSEKIGITNGDCLDTDECDELITTHSEP